MTITRRTLPKRHAIPLALGAFLVLTALVPVRAPHLVDPILGEAVTDASLRPIDPGLRAWLEPLYGFPHLLSGLPDSRVAAWILWIVGGVCLARLGARWARGARRASIRSEALLAVGAYLPLALAPLPFNWVGILPGDWRQVLTPVGLPVAVWVVSLVRLRAPRGERLRRSIGLTARFVGVLGLVLISLALVAYHMHSLPGAWATGYRLEPPPDTYVLDVHAHARKDRDAIVGGPERIDLFQRHGVHLTAVTEHNRFNDPKFPGDPTYDSLDRYARERGYDMLVLPGQEFTTRALHLVLLNSRRRYSPAAYQVGSKDDPPTYGYDFQRLIADVHRDGGYVVVAHWWSHRQWYRVDWRLLVAWGVDGFEVTAGPERAPNELVEAWGEAGMRLFAASNFHGWRKSLYGWNLVDRERVNPERRPLRELDPYVVVDRLFDSADVRVVAAANYDPAVPPWLEPPAGVWRYFTRLEWPNRLAWGAALLLVWAVTSLLLRPRRQPPAAPREAPG